MKREGAHAELFLDASFPSWPLLRNLGNPLRFENSIYCGTPPWLFLSLQFSESNFLHEIHCHGHTGFSQLINEIFRFGLHSQMLEEVTNFLTDGLFRIHLCRLVLCFGSRLTQHIFSTRLLGLDGKQLFPSHRRSRQSLSKKAQTGS